MRTELYPEMIGLREAAARTGIPYDTLRRFCLDGKIAHIRTGQRGHKFLVNFGKLTEFLESAGTN